MRSAERTGPADAPFTREDLRRADALAANMSFSLESAQMLQERQQSLFLQTVLAFSQAIELRDPYTGGHAQRVTYYSLLLADAKDFQTFFAKQVSIWGQVVRENNIKA